MNHSRSSQKSNLFSDTNQAEIDRQGSHRDRSNISIKRRSKTTIDDKPTKNDEDSAVREDCFVRFGVSSSSEEKKQRISKRSQKEKSSKIRTDEKEEDDEEKDKHEQDQPAYLVEEIDAITALIIYHTYSNRHQAAFSAYHRARTISAPKIIGDDVDRFDALYSCLNEQATTTKKAAQNDLSKDANVLSNILRNRFVGQPDVRELHNFQREEQSRVYKEKQTHFDRVPFIPNILTYQRTCPHYDIDEMKWIRDHLC